MGVLQWIYASKSEVPFSTPYLDKILKRSRPTVISHAITGLLMCSNERTLGVFEGGEEDIFQVRSCVERDTRHRGVTTLQYKIISAREFKDWQMTYLRSTDLPDPVGFMPLTPEFSSLKSLVSDASPSGHYITQFWASVFRYE